MIASGERWPDGTLRPAVEDQLGAAAVLDALADAAGDLSVEAAVVLAALATVRDVRTTVQGGVSARERSGRGFAHDFEIATQLAVSQVVPGLESGVFAAAG